VTTINNEKFAVSPEARILAILLRVFAISVFGFITARFASYLIGQDTEEKTDAGTAASAGEIAALRHEIALLRHELVASRGEVVSRDTSKTHAWQQADAETVVDQ
jgi:voltage-gated potassium channel